MAEQFDAPDVGVGQAEQGITQLAMHLHQQYQQHYPTEQAAQKVASLLRSLASSFDGGE